MNESAEGAVPTERSGGDPAKEELDRLFSMSLDLLCIAGIDGYFKHVNPAFTRTLGYRQKDLLSKAFIEFVHPEDHENTMAAVEQLAQGLDVVDFENRYRAADGAWRWLAWRSTSVPEEGLIFAVARDITEHKQLQELATRQAEDLARSNADLEEFASIASHDLQAPLRSVRQLARWIEEDFPGDLPEKVADNLQTLCDRVDRMSRLVEDLLAYSRAGRQEEKLETTDTGALVVTIVELLGPPEGLEVVGEESLPVFETTRSPLEQVLRNLVGNSIDHHDRVKGQVTVSARERDEHWEFSVTDDGPGIPSEEHPRVFDMLWSLPGREHQGAGMGLALVRRIVDRAGGRVWLEPGAGRGTTFRFTWPKSIDA